MWSCTLVSGVARHQCVKRPHPREEYNYNIVMMMMMMIYDGGDNDDDMMVVIMMVVMVVIMMVVMVDTCLINR